MPIQAPLTFVMGALTPGLQLTNQEFANEIAAKLQAFFDDSAAGFQNGGTEPTSNVGPWLRDGRYWRFWNPATGSYSLGIFNSGWQLASAESTIDETNGLWYECDGRQVTVAGDQALFNAIGYLYNLPADMSGVNPINPLLFRIPDKRGRMSIGVGTGAGLTARVQGTLYGEESHIQTVAELAAHTHTYTNVVVGIGTGGPAFVPVAVASSSVTGSTGGGTAFNILSPCQADRWICFR